MAVKRVKMTVSDKDKGMKALVRMLNSLAKGRLEVRAGLLGKSRALAPSGAGLPDVVALGAIHEFGAPSAGIPPRPFIRYAWDKNAAKTEALLRKLVGRCYDGKLQPEAALNLLGLSMVADINAYVRGPNELEPNAPATIRAKLRKGMWRGKGPKAAQAMPRPLIDTARMLNAVTHEVVKK